MILWIFAGNRLNITMSLRCCLTVIAPSTNTTLHCHMLWAPSLYVTWHRVGKLPELCTQLQLSIASENWTNPYYHPLHTCCLWFTLKYCKYLNRFLKFTKICNKDESSWWQTSKSFVITKILFVKRKYLFSAFLFCEIFIVVLGFPLWPQDHPSLSHNNLTIQIQASRRCLRKFFRIEDIFCLYYRVFCPSIK